MASTNPVGIPWQPFTPMEVAAILRPLQCPWWIAGGHAIEHAAGGPLRPHGDVDVLILRRNLNAVRDLLAHWDFWAADPPGTLRPWQVGETLPDSVHDVWLRPNPAAAWKILGLATGWAYSPSRCESNGGCVSPHSLPRG